MERAYRIKSEAPPSPYLLSFESYSYESINLLLNLEENACHQKPSGFSHQSQQMTSNLELDTKGE